MIGNIHSKPVTNQRSQKYAIAVLYQCTNEYLFWSESNIEYYSPQPNCLNRIANIIRAVKYIRIIFE